MRSLCAAAGWQMMAQKNEIRLLSHLALLHAAGCACRLASWLSPQGRQTGGSPDRHPFEVGD